MSKLLVIEPHQLLDATYQLDTNEIRLIQLSLAGIYRKNNILEDKLYEINTDEFADVFNISTHAAYQALVDVASSLLSRTIHLKSQLIDPTASKSAKSGIQWISEIRYDPMESCVQLRWHRALIPIINNLGEENLYSSYLLENTRKMKSVHSIRLFRLLNKWTKLKRVTWKVAEFKRLMGIDVDSYTNIVSLRRDVIEKAVKDINNYSELIVDFDADLKGRKIVGFTFAILNKEACKLVGNT